MKALSIKQPWASLIAHGIKDIENRTWKTHFRGRIYIHASAKSNGHPKDILTSEQWDDWHSKGFHHTNMEMPLSAIIGEVDIVDCVVNHPSIWAEHLRNAPCRNCAEKDGLETCCLYTKPIYNWVLANAVLYDKPILNVKGKLSFWEPECCLEPCIACGEALPIEDTCEDSCGNYYHPECYNELAPEMNAEYEELKRNGEID